MKLSDATLSYRKKLRWLTFISVVLLFGPMSYFLVQAGFNVAAAGVTTESVAKVSLFSSSLITVGILTLIGVVRKMTFKSSIWILLIAIYLLLDNIMWAVVLIGVCQIADELFISPLITKYRNLLTINKEIDKRMV